MMSPAAVHYPELNQPLDGRYPINEILAARLWRRTYLAQDLRSPSQSKCIIHHFKQIPEVPNYAELMRGLFAKEAALLEEFGTHEQIPQLLARFEDDQGFYVVQEFVQGRSLNQELIPAVPWSDTEVKELLQEVLEPLAFIHERGGLHGNIKPDNLLRGQLGRLVLIGFGNIPQIQRECLMAYAVEGDLTSDSEQGYRPLEQLQGLPCAASDVYAVGMIAAQALTGKYPTQFQIDPQSGAVLWLPHYEEAIRETIPTGSAALNRGLIGIVNRMVQWDRSRRFGSAGEALEALQGVCLSQNEARFPKGAFYESPVESCSSGTALPVIAPAPNSQPETPETDGEPIATPITNQPFFLTRLLMSAIASPALKIGIGGTALTAIAAAIGWSGLNSVDGSQPNPFLGAISKKMQKAQRSVQAEATKPERTQTVSNAWLQDWTTANQTLQQAEQALNKGNWSEAQQLTQSMSTRIPYWKDKGKALERQVIAKVEVDSKNLLKSAYDRAQDRDFTAALTTLKQIVPETSAGAIAQTKVDEYTAKQTVKAQADLQKAYDRAILRDFTQALTYLGQIPKGTPAYAIAQKKVVEYARKAEIRAQLKLKAATERSINAIAVPQKISIDPPAHAPARQPLAAILHWRGYANAQISAADQPNLSSTVTINKSVKDLNPGSHLREATPIMAL